MTGEGVSSVTRGVHSLQYVRVARYKLEILLGLINDETIIKIYTNRLNDFFFLSYD